MIGYGIDVSHHQDPAALPWGRFAGDVDFVIARATYGAMRDRACQEHIRRARGIRARVGLYHFYRPTQGVEAQWAAFEMVSAECGIGPGDIVPTLDIERDPFPAPGRDVDPNWDACCAEFVRRMVETFGDAMVYITQREFGHLGKPRWVLERPLWVAHYTGAAAPSTPSGAPATIWQHRVGPYEYRGAGGYDKERPFLDQNRLLKPLPLVRAQAENDLGKAERERIAGLVALTAQASAEEAFRDARHGMDDEEPVA